ncbi:SMR domain-containing protein At5g58720-like isoform X1 [Phragmites australis]|uniref:SMR domain-containing protein At5g58720-like isoform X1 n=1 Tax=Phragmites australis TaxID=29695 RepID=UPI002D788BA5|nr:SMR domain-containing protein At5g58720-like isoform X1 [Phragmites australis]XP_062189435.1 SMR domain-containing protein At5g58720-like isoform X1 [Phragmites australis]
MKPSKKKSSKKKKPSPAIPAHPAGVADSSGDSCSPGSETLTLAAAAASETESSSSCEASTYTSAFTSGTASTSSFSAFSSSASTASSSAAGGDERRDLAWLLDAFASATIDQVDSAYRETGGDPFLAAGVLGSSQDTQPPQPPQPAPQPPPPPDLSPRGGSGRKKAGRRPKRLAVAATGMVAGVIGKDYTRSATPVSVTNACKGRDGEGDGGCGGRKYSVEEAEQFLCSMLGDNSDLGMGVVRDVLGQYVYDVEKALDALLDISGVSSVENIETCYANAERNGAHYPNIFPGNRISMDNLTAVNKQNPFQSSDEISTRMKLQSELEHGFLWGEHRISYAEAVLEVPRSATSPSRSTAVKTNPQQVLESLFKIPEIRTYEPSSMDWKKVVKKLQSFNSTIASNNQERPKIGDGYREFRGVAARHYDTMKEYYQRAALAYSKGDKSYASYLADEGKHYRELARMEDEKASRKIFDARNKHITNTVTIDLHGQHVKQAMRLLKIHMMICVCMPSVLLRVITGCGSEGSGKGKIKRTVIELVEKEHIEWREENSGTIVLRLGGPREYGFLENDSDTD